MKAWSDSDVTLEVTVTCSVSDLKAWSDSDVTLKAWGESDVTLRHGVKVTSLEGLE